MIDHVGIAVADTKRSKAFYDAALAPIGISMIMEVPGSVTESGGTACGYGKAGKPFFWFGDKEKVGKGFHIAFAVDKRKLVDAFYKAALAAGGKDNGAPGLRPIITPITMAPSCTIPMAITWKWSATCRNEREKVSGLFPRRLNLTPYFTVARS